MSRDIARRDFLLGASGATLLPGAISGGVAVATSAALSAAVPTAPATTVAPVNVAEQSAPVEKELQAKTRDDAAHFGTISAGDLTVVIGDNSSQGEHLAGYNGVWSVRHRSHPQSLFVPTLAGLNLEHVITGAALPDNDAFFEPRRAPMTFRRMSATEAELHQPPTPLTHVESWTRFRVVAPDYLEMDFRCVPRRDLFERGYLSLFWASYIHGPQDKSMYFLGGLDGQKDLWTQFCTPWHNDQSTVRQRDDSFAMTFTDDGRSALYKNMSRFHFDQSFFYGNFAELVWLAMFDLEQTDLHEQPRQQIRFTHSPSGGGVNKEQQTTNPAWDFQFLIPKPQVDREYRFRVRTMLRPRVTRQEMIAEYRRWRR
jgi:hypothetical protein